MKRTTKSYTAPPIPLPPKKRKGTRGGKRPAKADEWPELDASVPGGIVIRDTYRPTKAERADGDT